MRLQQFIFENKSITYDDIIRIKNDCAEYFYESRFLHKNYPIYRRMNKKIRTYDIIIPRKNRKPLDTPKEIHKKLDELFKKEFGWKARSEGVFCSGDAPSSVYGDLYYIFPIDKFKYVWSPDIRDLTLELERFDILYIEGDGKFIEGYDYKKFHEILPQLVSTYKDNDLQSALRSGNEISLKCKKYYAINASHLESYPDLYEEMFEGGLP